MTAGVSQPVASVARALDLLEALASEGETGLVELSRRTQQRPSTTHRLLATLIDRGYVRRGRDSNGYLLSYRVLQLAGGAERNDVRLKAITRPYMQRIHRVCGETTNLIVLDGTDIVYVDQLAGRRSVRMFAEPGRRVPAHATGAGKAMLAFAPDVAVQVKDAPLARFTARTITCADELTSRLASIRRAGFAIDNEEYEDAVTCIAAPVFDHTANAVAAISVSGPSPRLGARDEQEALGELIGRAAIEASRELGYDGPSAWL